MRLKFLPIALCLCACACAEPSSKTAPAAFNDSASGTEISAVADSLDNSEYADYFIVIADTSEDYFLLRDKMLRSAAATGVSIDTMNRSFVAAKHEICLPDNDEDEIYAGSYFPRRDPGKFFSIEHTSFYLNNTKDSCFALVVAICETQEEAASVLQQLKPACTAAFTAPAKVFVGCMH